MARIQSETITTMREYMEQCGNWVNDQRAVEKVAEGVAFEGKNQLFLATSSPHSEAEDNGHGRLKLARAMQDSLASQIQSTCSEATPYRGTSVFGSCTYKDLTKLWLMDVCGVFRLQQFDVFCIPTTKQNFRERMKKAMLSSLSLAARVEKEIQKRQAEVVLAEYSDRVKLIAAASMIIQAVEQ
jgi:hypothetical protein